MIFFEILGSKKNMFFATLRCHRGVCVIAEAAAERQMWMCAKY